MCRNVWRTCARFYGELESVLIAAIQYVKNGKDGGWLGYEMLKDGGIIPQKNGRNRPAMEMQKPPDPARDREQARIRMIATPPLRHSLPRNQRKGMTDFLGVFLIVGGNEPGTLLFPV
jgi:hypothetical protein